MGLSQIRMENGYIAPHKALVKSVEKCIATNGKPFYKLSVCDSEKSITANVFDVGDEILDLKGKVISMTVTVKNGYLNISAITKIPGANKKLYAPHAPIDEDQCMDYVTGTIEAIDDAALKAVTNYLVSQNEQVYRTVAAGKMVHHDCLQGLLYHVTRMLVHAKSLCKIYPVLNRDLLMSATILHDIGKVKELKTDEYGATEYTTDGHLFGHLLIGCEMIDVACLVLNIDLKTESIRLLKHCIAAHHNLREHGAIQTPSTPEATALAMLDDLDAKMYIYERTYGELDPGQITEKTVFGLGSRIYRPEQAEQEG